MERSDMRSDTQIDTRRITAESVSRILQRFQETNTTEMKRISDLFHSDKSVWQELFKITALDALRGLTAFLIDGDPAQMQAYELGFAFMFYTAGFVEGVASQQARSLEDLYQK